MNTMSLEERVEVKENSEGVELVRVRGVYFIQSKAGVHVLVRGVDGRVESQVIFSAFANSFTCGGTSSKPSSRQSNIRKNSTGTPGKSVCNIETQRR